MIYNEKPHTLVRGLFETKVCKTLSRQSNTPIQFAHANALLFDLLNEAGINVFMLEYIQLFD